MRISDWSSDVCSSDLTMCALWRSVLQCDEVGPDDDFFALGGDYIMAIQIVGRARAHGLALTPTQVLEATTPRGPAQLAAPVGAAAGRDEIGRASCREKVCQYVSHSA